MDIDTLASELDRLSDQLDDWDYSPILLKVPGIIADDIANNFTGSHTPDGNPWPPLKDRRASHQPLIKTGTLMQSVITAAQGAQVTKNSVSINPSSLVFYWSYQNSGTKFIPAREFIGISFEALNKVTDLLEESVANKITKSFGSGI